MSLRQLYQPVEAELAQVEAILKESVQDTQNPRAAKIAELVLASPGKRIRPALCLLVGKAVSQNIPADPHLDSKLIKIATAFELIHMASLVHDDVIDQSDLRHNKPTINSVWGEDASVAFGDFLYSISSQLTSDCKNLKLHSCMSQATRDMCEGELLQVCERQNFDLSRDSYITIVAKKTAGLFASSCEAGAIVYKATQEQQTSLREFGRNLGIAFQMIDDYLDLVGEEKKLGKNPGQDVEFGKLTLPLLYLLEEVSPEEKREVKSLLSEADNPAAFEKLKEKLFQSHAETRTIQDITSYMTSAATFISFLPDSPYKESLVNLIDFIIERALSYSPSQK